MEGSFVNQEIQGFVDQSLSMLNVEVLAADLWLNSNSSETIFLHLNV